MKMVEDEVGSVSAKRLDIKRTLVVTNVGRFDDSSQEVNIRRYLTLSNNNISDRRLLLRMKYWFSGRYVYLRSFDATRFLLIGSFRLTASLIELFLSSESVPRHRVLTEFVEGLTGFKIIDATELEDEEPFISDELYKKIRSYQPITSLDRLFTEPNSKCNMSFTGAWTNRVFDRRGIDTMPS